MPDGEYTVKVSVDGVDVPDANHCAADDTKCIFQVSLIFFSVPINKE